MCLETQQKQEKIINENDNLQRQRNTADSIRGNTKSSKNFFTSKSAGKHNGTFYKTQLDMEGSNDNVNVNVTGNEEEV